jgi:hypothetical protein
MFCTNGILLKLLIGRGTNTTSNIQRSKHPGDDAILEITHIIVVMLTKLFKLCRIHMLSSNHEVMGSSLGNSLL